MKRWSLSYELKDTFSSPVTKHHYTLRCLPRKTAVQKTDFCNYEILPCSDESLGRDCFGNELLAGFIEEPHDYFQVNMHTVVSVENTAEPAEKNYWQLGMFRNATPLTAVQTELTKFADTLQEICSDPWTYTTELMHWIFAVFRYEPGQTNIFTTAEQAWALGCGVCQDYAHILLALCRRAGITARYVAGAIPGEGESHAWIEVWKDGFWGGFDPTHNRQTDDRYISFAVGRDARDCELNRGIFLGASGQEQQVCVKMEEMILD